MNKPDFMALTYELMSAYHCHTVILYGSWCRDTATEESDIDIIGILKDGEAYPLATNWRGFLLDAWLYPDVALHEPELFLHVHDGRILGGDLTGYWNRWLGQIKALWRQPPAPLSQEKREQMVMWAYKMLKRAQHGDVEGYYRQLWLAHDVPDMYFQWRNKRYPGPKEALAFISTHDPETYALLSKVYPFPYLEDLSPLIHRVFAPPDDEQQP